MGRLDRVNPRGDVNMSDSVQTEHLYVQRNPAVCGGDPVVAGTRIPVRLIYLRARTGQSIDVIQQAYPSLRPAQIYDALSYAHDRSRRNRGGTPV